VHTKLSLENRKPTLIIIIKKKTIVQMERFRTTRTLGVERFVSVGQIPRTHDPPPAILQLVAPDPS